MVSNPSMIGHSSEPAEPVLPAPGPSATVVERQHEAAPSPPPPDPTRYGDWEKNGRCIDF